MGTLANSEDPIRQHFTSVCTGCEDKIDLQRKEYNIFFEIVTCNPSIYTMDHLDISVSNFMENSIDLKRGFYFLFQVSNHLNVISARISSHLTSVSRNTDLVTLSSSHTNVLIVRNISDRSHVSDDMF